MIFPYTSDRFDKRKSNIFEITLFEKYKPEKFDLSECIVGVIQIFMGKAICDVERKALRSVSVQKVWKALQRYCLLDFIALLASKNFSLAYKSFEIYLKTVLKN